MSPRVSQGLSAVAVIGTAVIGYWFLVRPGMGGAELVDSVAFAENPAPFIAYVVSALASLWIGVPAVAAAIERQTIHQPFVVACLATAWSGVWLSASVGVQAEGGITMHYYWWGFALIWSFIVVGIGLAHRRHKPAVVRDWTLHAYGLAVVPILLVIGLPLWRALPGLDADGAMVTAGTLPFAAVFLVVHWVIFERLDRRKQG